MTTTVSRAAGIVILALLLVGAYALISASTSASGPAATAKQFAAPIKPPKGLTGEIQEGTGI